MTVLEYDAEARTPLSDLQRDELPANIAKMLYALDAESDKATARVNANYAYEDGLRESIGRADINWAATKSAYQRTGYKPDARYEKAEAEHDAIVSSAKQRIADSQADSSKQTKLSYSCHTVLAGAEGLIRKRGGSLRARKDTYVGGDPAGEHGECLAKRKVLLKAFADVEKRPAMPESVIDTVLGKLRAKAESGMGKVSLKTQSLRLPIKAVSLTPDLPGDVIPAVADLEGIVIGLAYDKLEKHVRAEVKRLYADLPKPISDRDRAAELERISKELKALEYRESAAFWAAWERGIIIAPRPDISPEAALLVE